MIVGGACGSMSRERGGTCLGNRYFASRPGATRFNGLMRAGIVRVHFPKKWEYVLDTIRSMKSQGFTVLFIRFCRKIDRHRRFSFR